MPAHATPAAGGVVWRRGAGHAIELAVVHRARYDDWSLPKGKVTPGESILAAAVREIGEEVGAAVAVSRRLNDIRYRTSEGHKTVSYWAMRYLGDVSSVDKEVDEIAWLSPKGARKRLSYDGDRRIVSDFAALPVPESLIILVRHAKAGKRSEWRGDDLRRPLDFTGRQHALSLVPFLRAFAPDGVYSADLVRCVKTVEPLAAELGLSLHVDAVFSDAVYRKAPDTTETAVLALGKPGRVSVVCSQGDTIPGLIESIGPNVAAPETRKGSVWVLSLVDGSVVAADYYEDPTEPALPR